MRNIISIFSLACLLAATVTSCKKQSDSLGDARSGYTDAVGFGESSSTATQLTVESSAASVDQPLNLFLSAGKTYGDVINVTIDTSSAAVADYNTAKGTSYEMIPAGTFSWPATASIAAGSYEGPVNIKFDIPTLLTYGTAYALGLEITQVSGGPGHILVAHSRHVILVQVKNQYDGSYHVSGVRVHPDLGPFPFDYDENLSTVSGTSSTGAVLADLGEGLTLTVNPDNTVTLTGESRDVFPQAGKTNTYDPATQTFTLNYYYNTAAPRLINETLVRNP